MGCLHNKRDEGIGRSTGLPRILPPLPLPRAGERGVMTSPGPVANPQIRRIITLFWNDGHAQLPRPVPISRAPPLDLQRTNMVRGLLGDYTAGRQLAFPSITPTLPAIIDISDDGLRRPSQDMLEIDDPANCRLILKTPPPRVSSVFSHYCNVRTAQQPKIRACIVS